MSRPIDHMVSSRPIRELGDNPNISIQQPSSLLSDNPPNPLDNPPHEVLDGRRIVPNPKKESLIAPWSTDHTGLVNGVLKGLGNPVKGAGKIISEAGKLNQDKPLTSTGSTMGNISGLALAPLTLVDAGLAAIKLGDALEKQGKLKEDIAKYNQAALKFNNQLEAYRTHASDIQRLSEKIETLQKQLPPDTTQLLEQEVAQRTEQWQQQLSGLKQLHQKIQTTDQRLQEIAKHQESTQNDYVLGSLNEERLQLQQERYQLENSKRSLFTAIQTTREQNIRDMQSSFDPRIAGDATDLSTLIQAYEQALQNPFRHIITEKSDELPQAYSQLLNLTDQLTGLLKQHAQLRDELRGLSQDAQKHAEANKALSSAKVETAKNSLGFIEKVVVGLPNLGLGVARSIVGLSGTGVASTASTGLTVIGNTLGAVGGGLSIASGALTIGLEGYKLHKAHTQKAQIQTALESVKNHSNDELLKNVAEHAIAKKGSNRILAAIGVIGGVLGVIGGGLAIAAIAATGVGAIALAGAAIGVGLVSTGIAVGTVLYKVKQGKADATLQAQVTAEALGNTLNQIKERIQQEYTERNIPLPNDSDLNNIAEKLLARENKYFAVKTLVARLSEIHETPNKQWALQFVKEAGMTDDEVERLKLLATSTKPEDKKAAQAMLEKHFLS